VESLQELLGIARAECNSANKQLEAAKSEMGELHEAMGAIKKQRGELAKAGEALQASLDAANKQASRGWAWWAWLDRKTMPGRQAGPLISVRAGSESAFELVPACVLSAAQQQPPASL